MTSLAAPAELAALLRRDVDDTYADLLLQMASGLVRGYCRWQLDEVSEDLTVDGVDQVCLLLPTMHLLAVDIVTVDGVEVEDFTWSTAGILTRDAGWAAGPRGVVASVTHGYDPVPDDVMAVVLSVASRVANNPDGVRARTVGAVATTFGDGSATLLGVEERVLDRYRLP